MIGSTEAVPIRPVEQPTLRAVSPLSGTPLREVCASCGNEVLPPGFVIPDFEELGAFCDEACGDQRFRRFLEETPADYKTTDEGQHP